MSNKQIPHKKYSDELRIEIVEKYFRNEGSSRSLAKEYNMSFKTIDNWIQKHKRAGYNFKDNRNKKVGKKKEVDIDYKERYEILKNFQTFLKAQRKKK